MSKQVELVIADAVDEGWSELSILVDGKKIADGFIGGEPEDNARWRTYSWIETALKRLALSLGAEFQQTVVEAEKDE